MVPGDAVLSYTTSGDIDAVVLHMLAIALIKWPCDADRRFLHPLYVSLGKRKNKHDVYDITKIIETLESKLTTVHRDLVAVVFPMLSVGGNDFFFKFQGMAHDRIITTILKTPSYIQDMIQVDDNTGDATINRAMYQNLMKQLYCPDKLNHEELSYEEVRDITIRPPTSADFNPPWKWLPPPSVLDKVCNIIDSTIAYMKRISKPVAKVKLCPLKESNGVFEYDFGNTKVHWYFPQISEKGVHD